MSCFLQHRMPVAGRARTRTAQLGAERCKLLEDVLFRRHSAAFRKSILPAAHQSKDSSHRVNTYVPGSTTNRFVQRAPRTLWLEVRGYLPPVARETQSACLVELTVRMFLPEAAGIPYLTNIGPCLRRQTLCGFRGFHFSRLFAD